MFLRKLQNNIKKGKFTGCTEVPNCDIPLQKLVIPDHFFGF